jgi:pimeloyl-ACP methyl ester carboxylesterase
MRTLALATIATSIAASTMDAQQAAPTRDATRKAPPANGHYADVNGVHLYYEIHGTGKPLVLLHGGLGAGAMFGENVPALAKGRQVILVDLQGHGRTADVDRPLDPRSMADDVAALVRHLKLGRADVMGFSLGAAVALQTAIRHADVVNKVVAVSAIARRDAFYPEILPLQANVNAAAAEGMKQTPMYALYSEIAPRPQDFPRLLDKIGALMRQDHDYRKEIATIAAPVMFVQGDADIVPPSHAVELFGLLGGGKKDGGWDGSGKPKSRLAILPGLTHYDIADAPILARTAIAFLDEK